MNPGPPPILRHLLKWILPPGGVWDGLLGDLDELYADRVRNGRLSADVWYMLQLLSTTVHYPPRRLWAWGRRTVIEGLRMDLGYALRMLRRRPGFAAVVVLTLALGIGANTAVFSVVRSVLLRPLPFPEDERLAVVFIRAPDFDVEDFPSSAPEYIEYRDHTRSWEQLAAWYAWATTVTGDGGEPERVEAAFVTGNLFRTLGIEPVLGRTFTAEENEEGSDDVAVLSHSLWMSRYGGEPGMTGRAVLLDGRPRTVVGIMPAEFRFPTPDVQVWLPLVITSRDRENRGSHNISIVGRLRPGVTIASAEAELAGLTTRLAGEGVDAHTWHPIYLRSLRTETVGDVSRTLWAMMGAVVLVLVIACANVANLLLVRAEDRTREMSLRTALGAGRTRLVSQILTESLVLAGAGGLAGVVVAYLGAEVLRWLVPSEFPRIDEIGVDANVLAFTTLLTVGTGIVIGLVPALQAGGADLQRTLREEGRTGTAGRRRVRLRQLLVVAQTSLAVVLLVGAGLLVRSFRHLMAVEPGFRVEQVLTAKITIPSATYDDAQDVAGFYQALLPRIASLPGVTVVGAARLAPLAGALSPNEIEVEGRTQPAEDLMAVADVQAVTPGYFEAMGIPVLEGRAFEERDGTESPLVAIVSASLARAYWPGRNAVGGGIRQSGRDERYARVIGVVPDIHQERLERLAPRGTLYLVHAQTPYTWVPIRTMTLTVRTSIQPTTLVSAIRREVQALDPSIPLYHVRTMEQAVAQATATRRFSMLLQLLFAFVALSLAAVGLYGVLAFTVARRRAEIGIRMALGADRSDVRRMVVGQGMVIVAIALAFGVVGALTTSRLLEGFLFGVSPSDTVTYAIVVGVLLLVALVACWIPTRRASAVDPAEALRAE